MDYNSYDNVMWKYKVKKWKPPKQEEERFRKDIAFDKSDDSYKLTQFIKPENRVDIAEKNDVFTDITEDTLLVAKQFMVFAHLRCPKPPLNRYARGLLSSTIRCQPTYYLGMNAVNVLCGNAQAFYMPYTNEVWKSAKAYPVNKAGKKDYEDYLKIMKSNWEFSKKTIGDTRTFGEYKRDVESHYKDIPSLVRKNPNEHWWDKAVEDVVNLCQERGVMMNG